MTRQWHTLDPAAVVRNCPASEIEAILRDAVVEMLEALEEAECIVLACTDGRAYRARKAQITAAISAGKVARTLAKAGQS